NHSKWNFEIKVHWPTDLNKDSTKVHSVHIPVLAYTDNTMYIANSKELLSQILKIAE
ncbi:8350_t:CDS:1, partial [Gigaspora rosea]